MTRKLHPDNNSRLRIRAPAIIDAAMYLDAFQSQGQQVRVVVEVGAFKFEGPTFVHAVEELRKWFSNQVAGQVPQAALLRQGMCGAAQTRPERGRPRG
jgi:hypothetical protein